MRRCYNIHNIPPLGCLLFDTAISVCALFRSTYGLFDRLPFAARKRNGGKERLKPQNEENPGDGV